MKYDGMEPSRKLCPGVELQIIRQTTPQKTAFGLYHGEVLLFCIGGKLRFATSGKSVTLNAGGFCLLGENERRAGWTPDLPQGYPLPSPSRYDSVCFPVL